jgi:adenine-specific DNA-methyltransferase
MSVSFASVDTDRIKRLIDKFGTLKRSPQQWRGFNESENCKDFILPLFAALGWEVDSEEVAAEVNVQGKRADYTFRLNGVARFFLEAKKPSADVQQEEFGEQAISYAWHKSVPWAVLTNFETLKVFGAEWDEVNPERSLLFEIKFTDYLTDEKLLFLSRASITNGDLDQWAEREFKKPKRENVDSQLAKDLLRWRNVLFENLKNWNSGKNINDKQIAKAVQTLLDRLIFMRTTEDRGTENEHLRELLRNYEEAKGGKVDLEKGLKDLFRNYDDWYDSKLFEKQICDELEYENGFLTTVLGELYKNLKGTRYNFAEINADVLGSIYEQYLGQIQQGDAKNSKRKQQGIYYTPRYIVDYIVRNTLGELVRDKLPNEIAKLKVLDPACGSGSFLTRAFETLNQVFHKKGWDDAGTRLTVIPKCVYAVDLDDEAVEIAQLNLLLRMVYKRERLLDLAHNIECGNSLISGTDTEMKKKFGSEWKIKRPFDWHERFSEAFKNGGFDVIIGNPPYIKEYVDKSAFDGLHDSPYYQGKMDLWTLFACQAIDHLKESGYFSFIAPNNWLTNAGASIFRDKILKEGEIISFIDFGDFKVFQDAGIQTIIFVFKKGTPRASYPIRYAKVIKSEISELAVAEFLQNEASKIDGIESFITDFRPTDYIGKMITFATLENKGPIEKMRNKSEFKLDDDEVAQGIVGAPDECFMIPDNELEKFDGKEKRYLKRFYTAAGRYSSGEERGFIFYLSAQNFKDKNLDGYPHIKSHFEPFKEELMSAKEKYKTPNKPYFFLHRERDEKFFKEGPKIVCGIRVRRPSFYYTEDEYYGSRALNFIKTDRIDLKYLTGILNSRALYFWFLHEGKRLGDLLQMDKGPLLQAPIPMASKDVQKKVAQYVDQLQEHSAEISKFNPILYKEEIAEKQRELDVIDAKLDHLVYEIYSLGDADKTIIEKLSL